MLKAYETPSSIAGYGYCERLGALNKYFPFGGTKTVATVIGNLEHSSFQEYDKMYSLDCNMDKLEILGNDQKHEIRLDKVIEYVLGHYSQQYPSFYQHVLDEIPSIKFRLGLHYRQKEDEFKKLLNSSDLGFDKIIPMVLPFAIEEKLSGYGVFGRVDMLYRLPNGEIIPEDLKSHSERFDALIHQESHKTQLIAYAVLVEYQYKTPVSRARIFYTKDLTYENFKITKKDKINVLKMKDRLQAILNEGIPPVIDDPLKCKHCYKKRFCKELADSGVVNPTEYIPLEGDEK